ncbi:MAG TPA: hypothetical protein VJ785_01880 [Anaerolineales bacterium]|nr:hypothetical protein [Anaerolineales bacterium]
MEDIPFYKRPWAYITGWLLFLLIVYGWQIYRMGGIRANLNTIFWDLFIIFPIFFILWMAFFSQFVLPVKTLSDRKKIFDRLRSHLFRRHGPALFIRNGEIIKREGEEKQKGPGVIWLDSASAAVTRSAVSIKQTLGPGVHFIEKGEFVEASGALDLHMQSQSLGPVAGDKPFDEKKDSQTREQYQEIQNRRNQVSALTRDGIEVVPNISVTFRVNTGFPQDGAPGSRFGYRTGITSAAKKMEARDQDAIRNAILGEGINPYMDSESALHRVAWNRIPAMLSVDVWREYVSKFTLDELFKAEQTVSALLPVVPQSAEQEIDPLSQPIQIDPNKRNMQSGLANMLREINKMMDRAIKSLEKDSTVQPTTPPVSPASPVSPDEETEPSKKTALKLINEMVLARLTQVEVEVLGETGKPEGTKESSKEYQLLESRGLKVYSVSISTIRLNPTLEEQLIKQWSATWLKTAKAESEQLDRKRNVVETNAQEQAHIQYAKLLSREINELASKGQPEVVGVLKTLLLRSRALIRSGEHSDVLRRRMTAELEEIEDMIKWLEESGK